MISIKSFKHDRYFCNNSKHFLTKCKIIKMTNSERTAYNEIAIDNLKQMMINCVIFTYLIPTYSNYSFIEYLGINNNNFNNYYAFCNYSHSNKKYYYCNSSQLHFQQKLLDNGDKIDYNFDIEQYSKYTQLWIINNYKKLPNEQLISFNYD